MTLPEHVLVVRAEVPEDIEVEWNRWYDTVHDNSSIAVEQRKLTSPSSIIQFEIIEMRRQLDIRQQTL